MRCCRLDRTRRLVKKPHLHWRDMGLAVYLGSATSTRDADPKNLPHVDCSAYAECRARPFVPDKGAGEKAHLESPVAGVRRNGGVSCGVTDCE